MYRVTCITDGTEYDLHTNKQDDYKLIEPKLTMEAGRAGQLSFRIAYDHPNISHLLQMQSEIVVYEDRDTNPLWVGRMLTSEKDMYLTGSATCEGILAYLVDTQIGAYEHQDGVVSFLDMLIDNHNDHVEVKKRFRLGNVTVEDDNDYIHRSQEDGNYTSTMDTINDKLVNKLGGYVQVRYANGDRFIDYLDDAPASRQTIEFGENLVDLVEAIAGDELITAVIPVGAEYETTDSSGEVVRKRLNLKTYQETEYHPAGADYVVYPYAANIYGKIYRVVNWDDVTTQANLYAKALLYVLKNCNMYAKFSITALDLASIDSSLWSFRVCESVRVICEPHGIDQSYMVDKIEYDIANPGNSRVYLGGVQTTFSRSTSEAEHRSIEESKARQNRLREIQDELDNNIRELQQTIDDAIQEVTETFTEDLEELSDSVAADIAATNTKIGTDIANNNALITGQEGGYVVIDRDADGKPYQILIMDTADKTTATNVIRLNNAGLGFSTSGYGGPYTNAWTISGHLTASFITAVGTVTAGSIGGWSIGQTTISKEVSATNYMKIDANNGIAFRNGNNIMQISKNGIAFSNNGGTTWETAWGINGSFLAKDIATVNLQAGTVGGWTIGSTMISSGTVGTNNYASLSKNSGILLGNNGFSVDMAGNVTINKGSIDINSGNFKVTSAGDVTIKKGSIDINNGAFQVSSAGALTATSASITGNINSGSTITGSTISGGTVTGGTISGGTISGTSISGGTVSGTTISGGTVSGTSITGSTFQGINNKFEVTSAGTMTCTAANIGGFRLTDEVDGLFAFQADNTTGGMDYRTWIRTATDTDQNDTLVFSAQAKASSSGTYKTPFSVTADGRLQAYPVKSDGSNTGVQLDVSDETVHLRGKGGSFVDVGNNIVEARAKSSNSSVLSLQGTSAALDGNGSLILAGFGSQSAAYVITQDASGYCYYTAKGNVSSRKLKENIKPVEDDALDPARLYDVEVVQFNFRDDKLSDGDTRKGRDVVGFIVEDLDEIYPEAVYKIDEEDSETWSWEDAYIIPPMLKLIQDQHKDIEALKAEVEELKQLIKKQEV